jgi:hypothetical protein
MLLARRGQNHQQQYGDSERIARRPLRPLPPCQVGPAFQPVLGAHRIEHLAPSAQPLYRSPTPMDKEPEAALKALIDLLIEKGLLSSTELADRMTRKKGGLKPNPQDIPPTPWPLTPRLDELVEGFERHLVEKALKEAGGVKIQAARILGVDKDRMKYLCRKYGIR